MDKVLKKHHITGVNKYCRNTTFETVYLVYGQEIDAIIEVVLDRVREGNREFIKTTPGFKVDDPVLTKKWDDIRERFINGNIHLERMFDGPTTKAIKDALEKFTQVSLTPDQYDSEGKMVFYYPLSDPSLVKQKMK